MPEIPDSPVIIEQPGIDCSTPVSGKYNIDGDTITIDNLVLDTEASYAELCLYGEEYGKTPMTLIVKGTNKVKNLIFDTNVKVICEEGASLTFTDSDFEGFGKTGGYTLGENTVLENNTFKYKTAVSETDTNNISSPENSTNVTVPEKTTTTQSLSDNTNKTVEDNKITSLAKVSGVKGINKKGKKAYITWKTVNNAKNYELQIAGKKNMKKITKSVNIKGTKTTIKKLKKNKTYYVRIRAINGDIKGKWSKVIKIKIKK